MFMFVAQQLTYFQICFRNFFIWFAAPQNWRKVSESGGKFYISRKNLVFHKWGGYSPR